MQESAPNPSSPVIAEVLPTDPIVTRQGVEIVETFDIPRGNRRIEQQLATISFSAF